MQRYENRLTLTNLIKLYETMRSQPALHRVKHKKTYRYKKCNGKFS